MSFDKIATDMLFDYFDEVARKLGYDYKYHQLSSDQKDKVDSVVRLHALLLNSIYK